jgi:glycosyltransferase involved in cell wall biosynthesis
MSISTIIPVYNERENLVPLIGQLTAALDPLGREYEILFVDDGSTDGTFARLRELAAADRRVKVLRLRRNFGQTAALQAGIRHARGDVIVTLDGDLQNDPADVPAMLAKLDEGYDVVYGWRRERRDPWLTRRLPSQAANWLIARVTGFPAHDLGCALKVMRRGIAEELELVGEMHRFIAVLAYWQGARCIEMVTHHRPRRHGKTKYGLGRTLRVVLDLLTVKFMLRWFASPMKLFGMIGLGCGLVGLLSGVATVLAKLFAGLDMTGNPLLLLTVFSVMAATQFLSLGLLGEVCVRIYYQGKDRQNYAVAERLNLDDDRKESPPATIVAFHRDRAA